MASYGVKGAPIAMSAKEWRLHCQIPRTETSSYLRTSRATFIFDALRRTGWLGRVDWNLCISESEFAKTLSLGGGIRTSAYRNHLNGRFGRSLTQVKDAAIGIELKREMQGGSGLPTHAA